MITFKNYISENLEHESIKLHMADKDFNVTDIKQMTMGGHHRTHVTVNNLPADKDGMVPEEEFNKAQLHLQSKFGDKYMIHTPQKIRTTAGGRF